MLSIFRPVQHREKLVSSNCADEQNCSADRSTERRRFAHQTDEIMVLAEKVKPGEPREHCLPQGCGRHDASDRDIAERRIDAEITASVKVLNEIPRHVCVQRNEHGRGTQRKCDPCHSELVAKVPVWANALQETHARAPCSSCVC